MSDLAVTRSGGIRKRENTSPRWVQIGTVVLAILNIILEAGIVFMISSGTMEHRGLPLSTLGMVVAFFALFSIPVRRSWTLWGNGLATLYLCGWYLLTFVG